MISCHFVSTLSDTDLPSTASVDKLTAATTPHRASAGLITSPDAIAAAMEHETYESVKRQSQMETTIKTEVEAATTSAAHIDIESDLEHLKQEPELAQSVKSEPALLVKEEILEDSSQDVNDQQGVQGASTPTGTGSLNEACSTRPSELLNVKNELADIDIGPTVLQHMDIHYTINKHTMSAVTEEFPILDDCNEAMPSSGVKKESVEDKLRVDKTIPCKYCGEKVTEYDNDEMNMRFSWGQQKNLQQYRLRQHRRTRTNVFKCDRTIYKPHLLCVHNKLHQQNSRKISILSPSSIVTASSNQRGDETAKTKQKPVGRAKEYSSRTAKFAQSCDFTKERKVLIGKKPYQCDACDTRFATKNALVQHIRVHTGEKPYLCDTCNARFSQSSTLVQHIRIHTGEKPYRCDRCDARFAQSSHLYRHMKVHTGVKPYTSAKPYQCDRCDARFAHSSHLYRHVRDHTCEKPGAKLYQCETCDARFTQKGHIVEHIRVHTGAKPYRCNTCDARFAHSVSLGRHIRVHTGEKPYQCGTCDKRFATNWTLVVHIRVHTGEKPYRCETCDARFAANGNLVKHIKTHHR